MPTTLKTTAEILTPKSEVPAPIPDRSDVRSRLEDVSSYYLGIHTRATALRNLIAESKRSLVGALSVASGGEDRHYGNAAAVANQLCQMKFVHEYIARCEVLRLMEESEDFKTAEAIIQPLLAELAEVEAEEIAAKERQGVAERALAAAVEAAKAKAIAAAENDPAVKKARAELEAAAK